ncbi:MAG: UDP-3-O-(3-hydroxymyristoyl)glucosamine N-acyltransferase, partial [Bacteroidales bacterium]
MDLTSKYVADRLGGTLEGDPNVKITSVARIENGKAGAISFLANPKYEHYVYTCKSSVILINKTFEPKQPLNQRAIIRVEDSYKAIAEVLGMIQSSKAVRKSSNGWRYCRPLSSRVGRRTHIGNMTYIGKNVRIGSHCDIYPQVYLGDGVTVGDGCIIYPGVRIYHDCKIGNGCILHSNSVVGADGFGFASLQDGSYEKIPQTGNVVIEDDVEVGANSCI